MFAQILLVAGLLIALLLALEAGFRLGRRDVAARDEIGSLQVGSAQGAALGLLALLLGFSFAGAAGRFHDRQDLIVTEANAIGTVLLRASLLDESHRTSLRALLAEYLRQVLDLYPAGHAEWTADARARFAGLQERIWKIACEGVAGRPETTRAVLDPLNLVFDLHASRLAAARRHLPMPVLLILVGCSCVGAMVLGYGNGLSRRRSWMAVAVLLLIGAALITTIDLDHPRAGLIQVDDTPLRDLSEGAWS